MFHKETEKLVVEMPDINMLPLHEWFMFKRGERLVIKMTPLVWTCSFCINQSRVQKMTIKRLKNLLTKK